MHSPFITVYKHIADWVEGVRCNNTLTSLITAMHWSIAADSADALPALLPTDVGDHHRVWVEIVAIVRFVVSLTQSLVLG